MQGSAGVRVLLPVRQREPSLTLGQPEQPHAERTCEIRVLNPLIHGAHCDSDHDRRTDAQAGKGRQGERCPAYQRASPIAVDTEQLFCALTNG